MQNVIHLKSKVSTLESVHARITDLEDEINKIRRAVDEAELYLNVAPFKGGFPGNEGFARPLEGGDKEPSSSSPGPLTPWNISRGLLSLGGDH